MMNPTHRNLLREVAAMAHHLGDAYEALARLSWTLEKIDHPEVVEHNEALRASLARVAEHAERTVLLVKDGEMKRRRKPE